MGWNSWNSFATTITEAQTLENAQIMARDLLPSGYDILTVDIQWYDPSATGYDYNAKPVPAMDGHGRLLPAPNRFPSSAGGKGFAPLASQVHAMGLRFGVHLLRGIPASPWSATCRFWARRPPRAPSPTPTASARGTRTCTASTCAAPALRPITTACSNCWPHGAWISSRWMT
jgi:hypothetical protein